MIKPNDQTQALDSRDLETILKDKTITKVDNSCVNCLNLEFSDGTELRIEVEAFKPTLNLFGLRGYIRPNINERIER